MLFNFYQFNCLFRLCLYLGLLSLFLGCSTSKPIFHHKIQEGPIPWTHDRFDRDEDKFAFAIISDLYGGERSGVIEVALEQINLFRPEFIMSVGDLIDGGTEDKKQLTNEWDIFDNKANKARAPLFYTGGNHDLTNTVMRDIWKQRLGPRYYHFIYQNVLFLVLDSEDYEEDRMQKIYIARAEAIKILDGDTPSKAVESEYFKMPERRTGRISPTQSDYFKNALAQNPNVRWTILFMHKPVWMREDQEGLKPIEEALASRPFTVFNGHFHTYSHTTINDKDYIMLGTTGGSQNDKSDMAFDHFTMVTMTDEGPSIVNLKLESVLNKKGQIPANGDKLCFQASKCQPSSEEE